MCDSTEIRMKRKFNEHAFKNFVDVEFSKFIQKINDMKLIRLLKKEII